jgi:peptidoglycan hydrolase CwlO-like protein
MSSMNEEMRQRMAERPDRQTLAWWDDRFNEQAKATRGVNHAVHLVLAEVEDQTALVKKLEAQLKAVAEVVREAQAAIGRLQAEVTELQVSMQKAREVFAQMKEKVK